MDAELETKLIECLRALESGEPLERVLSHYPEDAARLRPMLGAAAALPTLRMEPSLEAKLTSRKAFLAQAAALHDRARTRRLSFTRPLTAFASLMLALIIIGSGVVAASGSALPGDPLYGVKRLVDSVRLALASDPAALAAQLEQERMDEIQALLDASRETEVEFSAIIESIQPDAWTVPGLTVRVNGTTRIDGDPVVGHRARVRGRTIDGVLIATSIIVEPGGEPAPAGTPVPEATPTPQPQGTPSRTPGPGLTLTPVPLPTLAPVQLPPLTPEQLLTLTPLPPITPMLSEVEITSVVETTALRPGRSTGR